MDGEPPPVRGIVWGNAFSRALLAGRSLEKAKEHADEVLQLTLERFPAEPPQTPDAE